MFRAAFRVVCMLLLATIIVDVTNTRCFKNSLTYRYSKQFGAFKYGKNVVKFIGKANDKLWDAWRKKDLSEIYNEVSIYLKTNARLPYQWFATVINHVCWLLETLRKHLNEKQTAEYWNPRHHRYHGKKNKPWKCTGVIMYGDKNMGNDKKEEINKERT